MSKVLTTVLLVVLAHLLSACPAGGRPEPIEIVWNEDSCVECRMAVSDRKFGCETISADRIASPYDDIGCLVEWCRRSGVPEGGAAYVRDFDSQQWIAAEGAFYLFAKELPTPMSYGLAAFGARESAEQAAQQWHGVVWDWTTLLKEWKP